MKKLIMQEFADFECIGGECPDTCCAGWKVIIDENTHKKYLAVEGAFGDEIRKSIKTDERGICYFEMQKDSRCPFLNEENLCRVYRTLGPEAMCDTCQNYPRVVYQAGDILFAAISISCPEAGRMILGKTDKQQYAYDEDPLEMVPDTEDWAGFNEAIHAYTTIHGILQERDFFVRERLASMIIYAYQMQELIGKKEPTDPLVQLFGDPEQYAPVIAQVLDGKRAIAEKIRFVRIYVNALLKTARIPSLISEFHRIVDYLANASDNTDAIWQNAFLDFDENVPETEQEQLLVYFLFRHFMEKYKNRSVWESTMFILMFYSAYRCLTVLHYMSERVFPGFEWRVLMIARMSRQFEHSAGVWEAVYENMRENGMDQPGFLLRLVN